MKKESCNCSAYEGFGSGKNRTRVNIYQCVIDGGKYPCYYILMPEKKWYEEHSFEYILRSFFWRLKHPFYAHRNKDKRIWS